MNGLSDWQKCCLAYQGGPKSCADACNHCARMAKVLVEERIFVNASRPSETFRNATRLVLAKQLLDHYDAGASDDEPVRTIKTGDLVRWVDLAMDIES